MSLAHLVLNISYTVIAYFVQGMIVETNMDGVLHIHSFMYVAELY